MRPTVVVCVALLSGCSDEVRFSDLDAGSRQAAIHAAIGTGAALAYVTLISLEQDALADGCVASTVLSDDPPVLQVTADWCTGQSGVEWDGEVTAENASVFAALLDSLGGSLQTDGPMSVTFAAFSAYDGANHWAFDGRIDQSDTAFGEPYDAQTHLHTDIGGDLVFNTDTALACRFVDDDAWCRFDDGSRASLDAHGGFAVAGDFSLTGDGGGEVVLTGRDELRLDLSTATPRGCSPVTIDGDPVEPFCFQRGTTQPEHVVTAYGLACGGDNWFIDAETIGSGIASVTATLVRADTAFEEVHTLARGSTDAEGTYWSRELATADSYVADAQTLLVCDEHSPGVLLEAHDEGGEVLACAIAGEASLVDPARCESAP